LRRWLDTFITTSFVNGKLPVASRSMDRGALKRRIVARYSTRVHMTCILAATCLVAMISSAAMLHAGLHDMRWRYAIVVTLSYLTFLCGVWVWLRLAGFERSQPESKGSRVLDGLDALPSGSGSSGGGGFGGGGLGRVGSGIGRGGGAFDGGGASASFAESGGKAPAIAVGDFGLGEIGGDDMGAIILIIVLALAIFLASGYLVWMAPEILTEAAFGAVLAGGLAKRAKQQTAAGWVAGVVKKTWWPFAIVLILAMVFAFYSKAHHPEAKTFREAIHSAIAS